MAQFPFLQVFQTVLGANGTFSFLASVPSNEKWEIREIRQQSTGAFTINGIRNSNSRQYSNASPSLRLPEGFIADTANEFHASEALPIPISLEGNIDFYIDVQDSSAAPNTVTIVLVIVKNVPGDN